MQRQNRLSEPRSPKRFIPFAIGSPENRSSFQRQPLVSFFHRLTYTARVRFR